MSETTWQSIVEQYKERAVRDGARIDELRQSTEHWHDTAQMLKRQRDTAEEERDGWKLRAMQAEQQRQIIRKNMDDLIVSVDVAMAHREAALRAECEAAKQSAAAAAAEFDAAVQRGELAEAECEALRKDAALLREFVSSDEIAMTYQTMGQYRAALLKFHTAAMAVQPTTGGEHE